MFRGQAFRCLLVHDHFALDEDVRKALADCLTPIMHLVRYLSLGLKPALLQGDE